MLRLRGVVLCLAIAGLVGVGMARAETPSWHTVISPNVAGQDNMLSGAAHIPGSSGAWAVGERRASGGHLATLTMHWSGSAWRIIPSPNVSSENELRLVVARTPTDVWAVGSNDATGVERPLVLHWAGDGSWKTSPIVKPPAGADIAGLVPLAAGDVWAVGFVNGYPPSCDGPGHRQLLEHWNGSTWRTVAGPTLPGETHSVLTGLARIPNTNHLIAVGSACVDDQLRPLVLRFDGSRWSVGSAPDWPVPWPAVAAASAGDIMLVGSAFPPGGNGMQPYSAHWNGTSWSVALQPLPDGADSAGFASVCRIPQTTRYLSAIGWNSPQGEHSVVERYLNGGWQSMSTPNPDPEVDNITGVACSQPGDTWAVGSRGSQGGGPMRTFVLRYR